MLPTNIKTYYMDVDKANAEDHPTWELFDDLINDYDLKDLSPASMKGLAERIKTDEALATKWKWGESRKGGPEPTDVD